MVRLETYQHLLSAIKINVPEPVIPFPIVFCYFVIVIGGGLILNAIALKSVIFSSKFTGELSKLRGDQKEKI